jgi:hypothetical protein
MSGRIDHQYARTRLNGFPRPGRNSGTTGTGTKPPGIRKAVGHRMVCGGRRPVTGVCRPAGRQHFAAGPPADAWPAFDQSPIRRSPEVKWQIAPADRVPVRLAGLARGKSKLRTCRSHRRAGAPTAGVQSSACHGTPTGQAEKEFPSATGGQGAAGLVPFPLLCRPASACQPARVFPNSQSHRVRSHSLAPRRGC